MAVDFNIATGKEQPLNRTGLDNVQETGDVQGMLVGVGTDADGNDQLVQADASAGIPAVGALFPREIIPEDLSNVTSHPWADYEKQVYMEDRTLSGDRATVIRFGIEMVNDGDTDAGFTPGKPVYLDAGGGITQDISSLSSGDIVQKVGVALTPEDMGPGANEQGRERILLAVEDEYEAGGEAVFSGDGAQTTFSISHPFDTAPSLFDVTAASVDAAGDYYVSATSSSLDITFSAAPASGTDNVALNWTAQE